MTKDWGRFVDQYGLIVQSNGDGGDSCNRSCAAKLLGLESLPDPVNTLKDPSVPGRFRRSPHPGLWYSMPDRMSRDQLIPLVIWLGQRPRKELGEVFREHLSRGLLFTYNTRRNFRYPTKEEQLEKAPQVAWDYSWKLPDLTGPEFWALYIRAFKAKRLYWLLPLLDLETLLNSVALRFQRDKTDVINHALILEFGACRGDNWVMRLARMVAPRRELRRRLDRFFAPDFEPPINELYGALD